MSTVATASHTRSKTLAEVLAFFRARAAELESRYHMRVDGVFGSYVRGEQRADSDVDVLVSFARLPALWEFIGIEEELSGGLGARVHLVHNDASPLVRRLQADLVPV
jgi:predicted nucleotidyltransferase